MGWSWQRGWGGRTPFIIGERLFCAMQEKCYLLVAHSTELGTTVTFEISSHGTNKQAFHQENPLGIACQ